MRELNVPLELVAVVKYRDEQGRVDNNISGRKGLACAFFAFQSSEAGRLIDQRQLPKHPGTIPHERSLLSSLPRGIQAEGPLPSSCLTMPDEPVACPHDRVVPKAGVDDPVHEHLVRLPTSTHEPRRDRSEQGNRWHESFFPGQKAP